VPLYGGGRTESTIRQAVARQERSEAELQLALRDTAVLVEREHMTVRQAAQRLRAHAALVRSARQGVQAAQQGVARGTHAQLEVLEAQGRLQAAQQEHAATVAELLAARVRLQGLAGELSVQALPEVERVLVRPVQVPTLSTR
jgi:outer membrane protein